jgi:glycosyltransferase involved in cell wall biosynthesis
MRRRQDTRVMSPGISVAVVTFNGERFIQEQLESIVSQHPAPYEIVISDDGSTDRTLDAVAFALAGTTIPVRSVGGEHVGLLRNVERAIRACEGTVIALSDQDDIWLPGRLEAIQKAFDDPAVTLWFSDGEVVDEYGEPVGARLWEIVSLTPDAQQSLMHGHGLPRLIHGGTVTGATMAFRQSVSSLALPLPAELDGPDVPFLHDGWLAVLAAMTGRVVTDAHPFTRYRQHERQFTAVHAESLAPPGRNRNGLATRRAIDREHARVRLILDRLVERNALAACSDADQLLLRELDEFLANRVDQPGIARTRSIMSDWREGRYDRFARGWRTALGDLLYPRR